MLVVELAGTINVLPPAVHDRPTRRRSCSSPTSARLACSRGSTTSPSIPTSRPITSTTSSTRSARPNRDRLSRFTANATLTGTVAGSELVLYQDPAGRQRRASRRRDHLRQRRQALLHDRRALQRRSRRSTSPTRAARSTASTRTGRSRPTTRSTTAPVPNVDSIWALRAAQPVPRLLRRADGTALHRRRRRQRLLRRHRRSSTSAPPAPTTAGRTARGPAERRTRIRSTPTRTTAATPRSPAASSITARQFPSRYQGSYFFADYAQNWIKRLTFDANGNVNGVFNFEPPDGSVDGPYGDIVYLTEGPDGALYYVDLGYSDIGGTFGVSKIRRIRYAQRQSGTDRGRCGDTDLRPGAARP